MIVLISDIFKRSPDLVRGLKCTACLVGGKVGRYMPTLTAICHCEPGNMRPGRPAISSSKRVQCGSVAIDKKGTPALLLWEVGPDALISNADSTRSHKSRIEPHDRGLKTISVCPVVDA